MRSQFFFVFLSLATSTASASGMAADSFQCALVMYDAQNAVVASSEGEFDVVRRPDGSILPAGAPDWGQATTGEAKLSLSSRGNRDKAELGWRYHHVVLSGVAYNTGCLTVSYCDRSRPDGVCMSEACAAASNPADPFAGWSRVDVVNGVPAMAPEWARASTGRRPVGNGLFVEARCNHLRTTATP